MFLHRLSTTLLFRPGATLHRLAFSIDLEQYESAGFSKWTDGTTHIGNLAFYLPQAMQALGRTLRELALCTGDKANCRTASQYCG